MRRAVLPLAALALLGETVLVRAAPDLPAFVVLPLHAAVAILAALLATRAGGPRRALPVVLLLTASALSILEGTVRARRSEPLDEAASQAAIGRDAAAVEEAFASILEREERIVIELPAPLLSEETDRNELFAALAQFHRERSRSGDHTGISLYGPGGEPVAWAGEASVLEGEIDRALPAPKLVQLVRRTTLGTHLLTLRSVATGASRIAVSELLLESPAHPEAWRGALRLPSRFRSEVTAEFLDPDEADLALQDFLSLGGTQYWKRRGAGGAPQLLTAIRSERGDVLALLTVSPEPPAAAAAGRAYARDLACGLVVLLAVLASSGIALALARASRLAAHDLVTLTILLIAFRLACAGLTPFVSDIPAFDYRLFTFPLPFGLARSPGDGLLTCLTLLGLAGLTAVEIRRRGRVASAVGVAAALGIGTALVVLTGRWVNNSSLNPAHVLVLLPEAAHVALAWAHAAIAFSAVILLLASLVPRGHPLPLRRAGLALLAAGALSHAALVREAVKVPTAIIESSLAPEVLTAPAAARSRVLDFLGSVASDPRLQAIGSSNERLLGALIFDAWRQSDLGRTGARSALAVLDASGRRLSSFAYGLPASVFEEIPVRDEATAEETTPQGAILSRTALSIVSLRVPLLRGDVSLSRNGRPIGSLAVLLSTERDNLPFLTLGDPLLRPLGVAGAQRTYDEHFGGAPLFVAYSEAGDVLFPSAELVAPLARSRLPKEGTPLWTVTRFGGTDYRTFVFQTPDGPRAIGYAAPTRIGLLAGLLREMILLVPLLGAVLALAAFLRFPDLRLALSPAWWLRVFAASYSRRVQAVVLASSLLPLILLSVIFRDTIERRTREGVERAGVQSAATIRRLLEDYAAAAAGTPGAPAPIGSRILFWISRTVHQDIHLFVDDALASTSRGSREASGLTSFRLDADVARAVVASRSPQILSEQALPGGRVAVVYAPVRLRPGSNEGLLAVPLVVQERDLTRAAEAIADALLVATIGLGVLLSGIGYLFARRLSVPIKDLAMASTAIAAGQLSVRVRPRGRDEIRQLIDAFNSMAAALGEQREDLRRRKDYIEAILLNVTTGVISTDAQGVVRTSNPAASLLLDLPIDLVGRNLFVELRSHAELQPVLDLWSAAASRGDLGVPREISVRRPSGEVRLRSVVLPLRESDGGAPGSIYLVEDVTEVMRSNRLAAWAEMARRIAHEIKNPLTPIQLSAEHLLQVKDDQSGEYDRVLHECVGTILAQVRELREISNEFSTYARLPEFQPMPLRLGDLVRSTLDPYRAAPPPGVRIVERIEDVPPVAADGRVLRRALVNLIENALQAMEGGGTLTVSLGEEEGRSLAEIVVADTGEGMDEATRARIFEPYFSTRDAGTGLGLAIARKAIEQHGGTIAAESAPGQGTRMILRLPLAPVADGVRS